MNKLPTSMMWQENEIMWRTPNSNLRQQKAIQCKNTSITKKSSENPFWVASLATRQNKVSAVAWADIIYQNEFTLAEVQQMHYEPLYGAVGDSIHCNTGLWSKIDVPHETRRGPESEGRLVSMFTNRGGFPFEIPFQCVGSLGYLCTNPYSVFACIYLFIYLFWSVFTRMPRDQDKRL